jgi:hypothetical protein
VWSKNWDVETFGFQIMFSGTSVFEQNLILAYYAASKQNSRQRWLA